MPYPHLGTQHSALNTQFSAILSDIGYFERIPTIAVAVSGGADSMALLLLAKAWVENHKGKVIALTVDHGLRKESTSEAKQIAKWCKIRKIEHHVLTWKHSDFLPLEGGGGEQSEPVGVRLRQQNPHLNLPPSRGKKINQATARDARYALLTSWCKKHTVLHLLTAHHQNDQAETLFFRLSRGSFIEGLASIPAVSFRSGVRLIRPLLVIPKSALVKYLQAERQQWIEDPSNQNPKYMRNVIRKYINDSDAKKAGELATRLGIIRYQLEHALARMMVHNVHIFPDGHAVLKQPAFQTLPPEQALRLLSALVQTVGGDSMQPRTEQLRLLYHDLMQKNPPKRRALSHCQFTYQQKQQRWQVEMVAKTPHIHTGTPAKMLGFTAKPLAGHAFLGLNRNP